MIRQAELSRKLACGGGAGGQAGGGQCDGGGGNVRSGGGRRGAARGVDQLDRRVHQCCVESTPLVLQSDVARDGVVRQAWMDGCAVAREEVVTQDE